MEGMESLLGQPVNAMSSFMGSSKLDRPDDIGGLNQFDQYAAYGNTGPSMGDPTMSMLGNIPLNDMGLSSGSATSAGGNNGSSGRLNDTRNDPNSINDMMVNPLGSSMPVSMSGSMNVPGEMQINPMATQIDAMASMGPNDGLPGSLPGNGMPVPPEVHNGMGMSGMPGNGVSPSPTMGGGFLGLRGGMGSGGMESGPMDPSAMMNPMGPMNMGNNGNGPAGHFNGGPMQGNNGDAGGVNAGSGFSQALNASHMPGMQMQMDNGMYPMGPQVGMHPNAQVAQYMDGGAAGGGSMNGMMPPHLVDQSQVPPSALANKRAPAGSRKKAQPRAQTAKKAAQPKAPRASKTQINKAQGASQPDQMQSIQNAQTQAAQPPNQAQAQAQARLNRANAPPHNLQQQQAMPPSRTPPGIQQQNPHQQSKHMLLQPQQLQQHPQPPPEARSQPPPAQRQAPAHQTQQQQQLKHMQQMQPGQGQPPGGPVPDAPMQLFQATKGGNKETPQTNPAFGFEHQTPALPSAGGTLPSAGKLPVRQFEFSTQQPPPPKAPGALRVRIQFVLTLNQELIKISMSSASGSDVFNASMNRLESNLHYLRQVHMQHDTSSALMVPPPVLDPIVAIPSLSDPYRRLKDMFKFRVLPS